MSHRPSDIVVKPWANEEDKTLEIGRRFAVTEPSAQCFDAITQLDDGLFDAPPAAEIVSVELAVTRNERLREAPTIPLVEVVHRRRAPPILAWISMAVVCGSLAALSYAAATL